MESDAAVVAAASAGRPGGLGQADAANAHALLGCLAERRGDAEAARAHYAACLELPVAPYAPHVWSGLRLSALRSVPGLDPEPRPAPPA